MIALIQRVNSAKVMVERENIAQIDKGLCVFLGIRSNDTDIDLNYILRKLLAIKFFASSGSKFEYTLKEVDGEVLVVPQFTLYGSLRKGTKPEFSKAMAPKNAKLIFFKLCELLQNKQIKTKRGKFGAYMQVELVNDGPVTFHLSSDHLKGHA